MPTKNPRIVFYLTEEEKKEFQEVAECLGLSVSKLARNIMLETLPRLMDVSEAIKLVASDPKTSHDIMARLVDEAQLELLDAKTELSSAGHTTNK